VPALAKDPESRERRNIPAVLGPIAGKLDAPRPPSGLSLKLRRQWDALWRSMVAQLLDPATDGPVIARLYELYALGERLAGMLARDDRLETRARRDLARLYRTDPRDEALVDQALVTIELARKSYNSTVASRVRVATEVRMLEAQLGLSPRSRLALGVMLLAGRRAMAEAIGDDDGDLGADYS
jgi:hypothetical protein